MRLDQNRIPFFPIIKRSIIREVDYREKEKIAGVYIRELFKDATYKDDLKQVYLKWKRGRKEAIQTLRRIAYEMNNYRSNANVAKLAKDTPVGIEAAAAIVTLRSDADLARYATIPGIVVDELATRAETKSEQILNTHAGIEDFEKLLDVYKEHTKDHLNTAKILGNVVVRFRKLCTNRVRVTIGIGNYVEEELGFVKSFVKETKLINGKRETIVNVVTIGGGVITRVIGETLATTNTIDRPMADDVARLLRDAAKAAGVFAGVAVIGIDIYSIVKKAIELNEGSPYVAAENITNAATELERQTLPELEDVIFQARLEAAEKCGVGLSEVAY